MQNSTGSLPPDVVEALHRGNKIEAIKRLRTATGIGLAEAKDRIDAHDLSAAGRFTTGGPAFSGASYRPSQLSPGEVSNTSRGIWTVVAVALAALAAWLFLQFGR